MKAINERQRCQTLKAFKTSNKGTIDHVHGSTLGSNTKARLERFKGEGRNLSSDDNESEGYFRDIHLSVPATRIGHGVDRGSRNFHPRPRIIRAIEGRGKGRESR